MTKIVGVDFGTTNVRVAQWDSDSNGNPSSCAVGEGGQASWMPAVITFRRLPGGSVHSIIGEDADEIDDGPGVRVIRNIKRWALTNDRYVGTQLEWHFEHQKDQTEESWPTWLDTDRRSIRLWNETMSVEEAIRLILKEAISRAGLAGVAAEWRAGCPVDSSLVYRRALVSALDELGCTGKVEWITEEPLLFLALSKSIEALADGSYLVYDLGGGSFDCAIVSIEGKNLTVWSEGGLPALGGMDIDDGIKKRLKYDGRIQLVRSAKEQLFSGGSRDQRVGGRTLTVQDVYKVLEERGFIQKTLMAALDTYKRAKLLWNRPEGSPPYGEVLPGGTVWSLQIEDMARDIDQVLVIGGPTLMPYFPDRLREVFGDRKVVTAEEVIRGAGRTDILDVTLTALSHGSCYMYGERYLPITVDRIPASITLKVEHGGFTLEDRYEPFQRLPYMNPLGPHVGKLLDADHHENPWSTVGPSEDKTYSVSIESPDGDVLHESVEEMRMPGNGYRGPRADRIRLIIDRLGSVWVELGSGFRDIPKPFEDRVPIVEHLVWQTETQQKIMKQLHEDQRRYEKEQAELTHRNVVLNPFGYGERSG